jgi:MFS family permease
MVINIDIALDFTAAIICLLIHSHTIKRSIILKSTITFFLERTGSMDKVKNRWGVALAGVIMQLLLGTVYGWSVFKKPLMEAHGWSNVEVGFAFTIVIFFLGVTAAIGGRFVDKAGASKVAMIAAILFGIGTLVAATPAASAIYGYYI